MKIFQDVLAELFSMFWADARMTTTILVLVAAIAALLKFTSLSPIAGGSLLLLGCLGIIAEVTLRETRKRRG
jgi:hypothetical protein